MEKLEYSGWESGNSLRWRKPTESEVCRVLQQEWFAIGEQEVPYIWLDVPDEAETLQDAAERIKAAIEETKTAREKTVAEAAPYICK